MWCDFCADISYSVQTTIRLNKDGHETVIEYCGHCLHRTETEYFNGPQVSIHTDKELRQSKRGR